MNTLLVDADTYMRQLAISKADTHERVLPAVEGYVRQLNLRCHVSPESDILRVSNDHGQWVTVCSSFNLKLRYELRWGEPVTTIQAHIIPMFMRHVLHRKTQLLEIFVFEIETPEFHDNSSGASGSLLITKK